MARPQSLGVFRKRLEGNRSLIPPSDRRANAILDSMSIYKKPVRELPHRLPKTLDEFYGLHVDGDGSVWTDGGVKNVQK